MRTHVALFCLSLAVVGCKKTTTTGGGGGGGGWLVGDTALMANVGEDGKLVAGYDLGASAQLSSIACRYAGEAWVAGAAGTLLYTNDAGKSWSAQEVPAKGDLRAVATQDFGPVFVVGDGAFLMTTDTGATWAELAGAQTRFRAVAAAQQGSTVLALSDDGGLWTYDGSLARRATIDGAHAVALSPDGGLAIVAGHGLMRSLDSGATWAQLAVDPALAFDDVRIAADGSAVAVGAGGAIATIDVNGAVTVQHVGTADLHALHIADAEDGGAAVGFAAGDGGQVLITHDAGATWALGPNLGLTVRGIDEIGVGHR